MKSENRDVPQEGEIDLLALWKVLWDRRWLIAIVMIAFGGVAITIAYKVTPIFSAEAVVTDVSESGMSNGSSLANQLGGLASLAGVRIGGASGSEQQAHAVLESRRLAEEFVMRNNLIELMAKDAQKPPTLWVAVNRFRSDVISIRDDTRKRRTTVTAEWTDPQTAAKWANGYAELANELIRTRALEESSRNIAYLNGQIAKTNVIEIQQAMYKLIESETKTLMLANARTEYAFALVDPAVPPEIRSYPRRSIFLLVGLILGGIAGMLIAFAHHGMKTRKAA